MKRFSLAVVFATAVAFPIWAGEIDGGGKASPSPTPAPATATNTAPTSAESDSTKYVLVEILLTLLTFRP